MLTSYKPHMHMLESRLAPANISAAGGGFGELSRVQVFRIDSQETVGDFLAFGSTFTGGVNVAIADVNLDGSDDVIVSAGRGGGPRVRVFDGRAFNSRTTMTDTNGANVLADFFAFEPDSRIGAFVTAGNIQGSANPDIIVGAGPGGGPRVRVIDGAAIANGGRSFTVQDQGAVRADFFAGDATSRNGVTTAFGGSASNPFLAVGNGTGGNGGISIFNGSSIAQQGTNFDGRLPSNISSQFSTGATNNLRGAGVSGVDFNNDGIGDIAVMNNGAVTTFNGQSILDGGSRFNGSANGDVLNNFNIQPGTLANGGFSNFGNTNFGGFNNFNSFNRFGGFNNIFGAFNGSPTTATTPPSSIQPINTVQSPNTFTSINGNNTTGFAPTITQFNSLQSFPGGNIPPSSTGTTVTTFPNSNNGNNGNTQFGNNGFSNNQFGNTGFNGSFVG